MSKTGLIAVAGIIGVGKTTLAEGLGDILPGRIILEEYDRNPFLAPAFAGRQEAALPSELFFLLSRARQLHKQAIKMNETVICDYIFDKNRIYAQMNLDNSQFDVYCKVEKSIKPHLVDPGIVIYLHDSVENCLERIVRRGREYEKNISSGWLSQLHAAYEELFNDWNHCPVICIDCAQHDIRNKETVQYIARQLLCDT